MGIYIPGLDASEKCNGCCMNLAGHCLANKGLYVGRDNLEYNIKPDWCPAMNIQPHGRLLDEKQILRLINEQKQDEYNRTHSPKMMWSDIVNAFEWLLQWADTIIPAEGGADNG